MNKRKLGILATFAGLTVSSMALATPSYCPTSSPTICSGRALGDILITLHGSPANVLGFNPNTGNFYVFSSAVATGGSRELGDIAVVPSNPAHVVVIGNVDDFHIGIQRLNSCGSLVTPTFGTFPETLPPPLPPVSRSGFNNRGVAFSPVTARAISPGMTMSRLDGSGPFGLLYTFAPSGGATSIVESIGDLVDTTIVGAVGIDEHGILFLGEHFGSRISVSDSSTVPPLQRTLETFWPGGIRDLVHDGSGHIFVTSSTNTTGSVWRVDATTGVATAWTTTRGGFGDGGNLAELYNITIDAAGNLWTVERPSGGSNLVRIDSQTGQILSYHPIPQLVGGQPAAQNSPQGLAVLGVNLPAVREACNSACAANQITDCFGGCAPADILGDDFCDDGPHQSLNCYARGYDLGDCNPCAPGEMPDCSGQCGPRAWIGDSVCDSGDNVSLYNGSFIDYDCPALRFDEATCMSCGPDEAMDCNGHCAPLAWYGDSICDDGGYIYLGNAIDFDCAEYDFDQHVCH